MPFTLLFRPFHGQIKFVAAIALAQELNKKERAGRMAVFASKYVLRSGQGANPRTRSRSWGRGRSIRNEQNKKIVMTKKMKINEAANVEDGGAPSGPQISESYTNGQLN